MAQSFSFVQPDRILRHSTPSKSEFYRDVALLRARSGTAGRFLNDTFDNSAAIHEAMFETAESRVRVIARGIKPEIFENPNVIKAAVKFTERPGTSIVFDIRSDFENAKDCELWLSANRFASSIVSKKHDQAHFVVSFFLPKQVGKPNNFLENFGSASLGDDRMYRQRTAQTNGDYSSHGRSNVDFCDPKKVSEIEATANKLLAEETLLTTINK